jgi:hypothetical protein
MTPKEVADISLISWIYTDGRQKVLHYELQNFGTAPALLLINMPILGSMSRELPFAENGFLLLPGTEKTFETKTEEPVEPQIATVVISDAENKQAMAVDVAGVYAPSNGQRKYEDKSLFDRLR